MPMMPPQQTSTPARRTRCERIQPVLVAARGDDLAVELSRGVEIVVVGGEPGFRQAIGLSLIEHAEGDASLHVERAHAAHHVEHAVEGIAVLHLAPGGAHAEAGGAGFFGDGAPWPAPRRHRAALFALQPGALGVMGRLRAVFAVLGAGPGLDRIEARKLDRAVGMMAAVHLPRLIDKIEQRLAEQGHNLVFLPIVAEAASRGRGLTGRLRPVFFAVDRIRESWKFGHAFAMRLPDGPALR